VVTRDCSGFSVIGAEECSKQHTKPHRVVGEALLHAFLELGCSPRSSRSRLLCHVLEDERRNELTSTRTTIHDVLLGVRRREALAAIGGVPRACLPRTDVTPASRSSCGSLHESARFDAGCSDDVNRPVQFTSDRQMRFSLRTMTAASRAVSRARLGRSHRYRLLRNRICSRQRFRACDVQSLEKHRRASPFHLQRMVFARSSQIFLAYGRARVVQRYGLPGACSSLLRSVDIAHLEATASNDVGTVTNMLNL
jgi:hypothetical protein